MPFPDLLTCSKFLPREDYRYPMQGYWPEKAVDRDSRAIGLTLHGRTRPCNIRCKVRCKVRKVRDITYACKYCSLRLASDIWVPNPRLTFEANSFSLAPGKPQQRVHRCGKLQQRSSAACSASCFAPHHNTKKGHIPPRSALPLLRRSRKRGLSIFRLSRWQVMFTLPRELRLPRAPLGPWLTPKHRQRWL